MRRKQRGRDVESQLSRSSSERRDEQQRGSERSTHSVGSELLQFGSVVPVRKKREIKEEMVS